MDPNPGAARVRWTLAAAGVLAAGLLATVLPVGGCTSDPENSVGSPLVETVFDTVLAPVLIDQVQKYSALEIVDKNVPVHQQQVLYMGEEGGTRSSILANFDFSFTVITRNDSIYPDSLFTLDNIKSVKFSLVKPIPYHGIKDTLVCTGELPDTTCTTIHVDTGQPRDLYYLVRQLVAPFRQADFIGYPNQAPPDQGTILNSDFDTPNISNEPFIRMDVRDFVRWFNEGVPIGIVIRLDDQSDPGLVGYASRENKKGGSQFDPLQEGTALAPNFQVELNNYIGTGEETANKFFLMEPYADTSTFEAVTEAPADPADEILLRTGMRSYPALFFDFGSLPDNVRINRAVLELTNDPDASFGPSEDIVTAEMDTVEFGDPFRTLTLTQFKEPEFLYTLSGERSREPAFLDKLELEVTPAVQRYVNRVTEGTKGILVSAWEYPPLTGGSTRATPVDFYYREFHFFGTSAPPDQRPRLKITYSVVDEISEGGH